MPELFTDEWVADLDAAVAADAGLHEATADLTLVVQQVVTGPPTDQAADRFTAHATDALVDPFAYHLVLDHGANHVRLGRHPAPDVTFTTDRATAVAVALGTRSAQAAFMAGELRLGGDARALIEHAAVLAELPDLFAGTRAPAPGAPGAPRTTARPPDRPTR